MNKQTSDTRELDNLIRVVSTKVCCFKVAIFQWCVTATDDRGNDRTGNTWGIVARSTVQTYTCGKVKQLRLRYSDWYELFINGIYLHFLHQHFILTSLHLNQWKIVYFNAVHAVLAFSVNSKTSNLPISLFTIFIVKLHQQQRF